MIYSKTLDSYTPDELISHGEPATHEVGITGGAAYTRGTVLGRITASELYTISLAAATDGSEAPVAILADDEVDATDDDKRAAIYIEGDFCEHKLIFGTGHDVDSVRESLRTHGIRIHKAVG